MDRSPTSEHADTIIQLVKLLTVEVCWLLDVFTTSAAQSTSTRRVRYRWAEEGKKEMANLLKLTWVISTSLLAPLLEEAAFENQLQASTMESGMKFSAKCIFVYIEL